MLKTLLTLLLPLSVTAIFGVIPLETLHPKSEDRRNENRAFKRTKERRMKELKDKLDGTTESEAVVEVGSTEYYKGFVTRDMSEEPEDRVTGDAILGPTFKFVGGFSVLIGALFLFFMVSNGLL